MKSKFRSFEDAKKFAQSSNIKNWKEWRLASKSKQLPDDIPSAPNTTYKRKWISWGDFLGTKRIQNNQKVFLSFGNARDFVQSLNLKTQKEWSDYCKSGNKPNNIPVAPNLVYKNQGYNGIIDWLGSKRISNRNRKYRSFTVAKKFVQSLSLTSSISWRVYCKSGERPEDIPSHPHVIYKNKGWIGYGDFLGNITDDGSKIPRTKIKFCSFTVAKKFVQSLNFHSRTGWEEYRKSGNRPKDIPSAPRDMYKKEWKGWGDFLGTGTLAPKDRQYRSFEEARKFVQGLKLKNTNDWKKYCKSGDKPNDIPKTPDQKYKKEWKGWGDFLDNGYTREYMSFEEARKFVQGLKLKNTNDWKKYCKSGDKPNDIPKTPDQKYKKEWKGWGDFLDNGYTREHMSFEEARKFAQGLGLKSSTEWRKYTKSNDKPKNIPPRPDYAYKNKGWVGYGDFLDTGRTREYLSFEEAREFVHSLKLTGMNEYRELCKTDKIPKNIPRTPYTVYKNKGWISFGDWFGTGTVSSHKISENFLSFDELKIEMKKLAKKYDIRNYSDWRKFVASGKKPDNIPSNFDKIYLKEWKGIGDLLGTGQVSYRIIAKNYLSFKDAKPLIQKLAKKYNIRNTKDWNNAVKKGLIPDNIPHRPWRTYKKRKLDSSN